MTFKSVLSLNPGTYHATISASLNDILYPPQEASNLLPLRELDADGLGYTGEGGMISMLGGNMHFPVKDKLYKLQGFQEATKSF